MYICPLSKPSYEGLEESGAVLVGQVDKKEYRISYEQEILVIYLKKVQILNPQIFNVETGNSQHKDVEFESRQTESPEASKQQAANSEQAAALSEVEGVLCYLETGQDEPKLGSYVKLRGKLKPFAEATNPGEFDARRYYEILGMQLRLQKGVILGEGARYDVFREKLWELKKYLSALTELCFEGDAHIMKAMLLGEKSGLEGETKLLYQLNGVIHILSISGLHISIIGMGLYKLLHKLGCPRLATVLISIGVMYSYGVMAGLSVSAVRAIVMFGFHIAAGIFGRTYDMLTAMAAAGILVLAGQPLYLRHSGFLFSFGAVLAIGVFLPEVEKNLLWRTKLEKLMSTSLAISIVTLPVYLCFYYEYPLYSVFLNLIIIPGTALIVPDGLVSIAAAAFFPPLGKAIAFPARLVFRFYELCCSAVLRLPGSRSILGKPKAWQVVIFIVIVSVTVVCGKRLTKLQFWQWLLAALLCITMRFQGGLVITALDVGQGDGIYIADERGGRYFIDGGSSSKSEVGTYQILPFLKEEGTERLDAVFVTHMDSDHYNGIGALIEDMAQGGIVIEALVMPDIAEKSRDDAYHELVELAKAQGIRVLYIHKGESIEHGKLKLTCLHPEKGEDGGDTNAASTVLYLEYEAFSALFTGDLEGEGEKAVIREFEGGDEKIAAGQSAEDGEAAAVRAVEECIKDVGDKGITLLKVAHHGSKNSTAQAFIEAVSPKLALISAGRDNRYGHPHAETLERLESAGSLIYRTDEGGAVTVIYRDGRVWVEEFLE